MVGIDLVDVAVMIDDFPQTGDLLEGVVGWQYLLLCIRTCIRRP